MIKPFYQGKLDTFCAIYAVLNALRLLRGLQTLKGRDILNDVLLSLARYPEAFKAVLTQETDYVGLVDNMLESLQGPYHLRALSPFPGEREVSPKEFWDACSDWMGKESGSRSGRTMVFRFMRYLSPDKPPLNRHWTTLEYVTRKNMRLFDSSHEAEAILNIANDAFATSVSDVRKDKLLYIQPDSVRFISLNV